MIPIKFNAWHPYTQKMLKDVDFVKDDMYPENKYALIYLQCIGKDINGKDICKDDIVKHKNGRIYKVEYSNINFWWCLNGIHDSLKGQDMRLHMCHVIGNVYQTPELLK